MHADEKGYGQEDNVKGSTMRSFYNEPNKHIE